MSNALPSEAPRTTPKKVAILFNPFAGKGKAINMADQAQFFVKNQGYEVISKTGSEYAGHIERVLSAEVGAQSNLIILIGGDGTLRELIAGLRHHQLKPEIAFIPMGNANVVARELNIPLKPELALKMLEKSKLEQIDIGILEQTCLNQSGNAKEQTLNILVFLAMLEIGIGAKIVHLVNQLRLGKLKRLYQFWGDIVYAFAGLLAFFKSEKTSIQIKTPRFNESSTHLVISNMHTYAKGWAMTPKASCKDGKLDIAIDKKGSRLSFMSTFLLAARKQEGASRRMHYAQFQELNLFGSDQVFMQVDGDPVKFSGNAKVHIEPQAFSIHVPK